MAYRIATKCIYGKKQDIFQDRTGTLSFPIYQSATFAHPRLGESTGYDYSRMQNPTREQVEKVVASLENGAEGIAFSSGMAALSAIMELFAIGDHILSDGDLYGGTLRLFNTINKKNGVCVEYIDCQKEDIESKITEKTKAIFIETPTNPMLRVIDIKKIAKIAKKRKILFIVDNTFLSPYFQNPLDLGADIVVHSGTKYLCGHNDTLAGIIVCANSQLGEKLRTIQKITGATLSPFDSWLLLRGIKTLAIRMEKSQENAMAIAKWLQKQEVVKKVYYPGLLDCPDYTLSKEQARGFGAMLTFEVVSKELAVQIINHLETICFAESLGGVETLITYPITQTHAEVPKEVLAANGITDRILRMSIGIEDVEDIIEELERVCHL